MEGKEHHLLLFLFLTSKQRSNRWENEKKKVLLEQQTREGRHESQYVYRKYSGHIPATVKLNLKQNKNTRPLRGHISPTNLYLRMGEASKSKCPVWYEHREGWALTG